MKRFNNSLIVLTIQFIIITILLIIFLIMLNNSFKNNNLTFFIKQTKYLFNLFQEYC